MFKKDIIFLKTRIGLFDLADNSTKGKELLF